jgi:glycosyltransferase involved in cell wall biosynthesis
VTESCDKPIAPAAAPRRTPIRVCHVAYSFYESDNRVIRYAETVAEEGNEVDVIALRRRGQSVTGHTRGVRVFRIQRRAVTETTAWMYLLKNLWFFVKASALLTALHLRKGYDIVHVHNVPDFLVFTAWLPKLTGSRIILDIHDILPELYSGKFGAREQSLVFRLMLGIERLSCKFADHVVVANDLWHSKLVKRSIAFEQCTAILNYPDLRIFKPLPQDKKRSDGKFIFLYPGTLNRHQGVDIAVKAFALVKSRMPDAELHIYGEGPAWAELMSLAQAEGMNGRVKLNGRVAISEITQVMASADVGLVPKRADGFGNEAFSTKTLEFMACGVPVIVSRTLIDQHYFDDSVVRFFAPGSELALAGAMQSVYEQRANHGAWIASARQLALQYSWQEKVGDYRNLIASLCRQPGL